MTSFSSQNIPFRSGDFSAPLISLSSHPQLSEHCPSPIPFPYLHDQIATYTEAGSHLCNQGCSRTQRPGKQKIEKKDLASRLYTSSSEIPWTGNPLPVCLAFQCPLFLHGLMNFLSLLLGWVDKQKIIPDQSLDWPISFTSFSKHGWFPWPTTPSSDLWLSSLQPWALVA